MRYAKALIASIGAAATSLLAIVPPHTTLWLTLTGVAAATSAALVYLIPNSPPGAAG